MIVRAEGETLLLIRQPDHAHLAGAIMDRCVSLTAHPRRTAVLHAVAEHDNGWAEEDRSPLVDAEAGSVYDFVTAPVRVRQRVWPRAVARLARDPWAAVLVAHHADTVYDRFHHDLDWTSFFAEIRQLRSDLLRDSGLPMEELVSDYRFVRLGDLISLSFCTGWTDEHRFDDTVVQLTGARVIVTPDLFGGTTVPIEIPARAIPKAACHSVSEFHQAFRDAEIVRRRGEVAAGA